MANPQHMKIFFVGMPGSGKTTLAEQVANALDIPFVDLDKEIEKKEGKPISEIFQQNGESYFRQVESTLLKDWAGRQASFGMSTGGGAPCHLSGMEIINKSGISIFIDVPVDVLVERTKNKSHRPLLDSETDDELQRKLTDLLSSREKIYRTAKFILVNPTLSTVLSALNIRT
jgi:shikimate kinase